MSSGCSAAALALSQVEAVHDDPPVRLELIARTYHGPVGRAPRHLPFRRALSFMRWQLGRGVPAPLTATLQVVHRGARIDPDVLITSDSRLPREAEAQAKEDTTSRRAATGAVNDEGNAHGFAGSF